MEIGVLRLLLGRIHCGCFLRCLEWSLSDPFWTFPARCGVRYHVASGDDRIRSGCGTLPSLSSNFSSFASTVVGIGTRERKRAQQQARGWSLRSECQYTKAFLQTTQRPGPGRARRALPVPRASARSFHFWKPPRSARGRGRAAGAFSEHRAALGAAGLPERIRCLERAVASEPCARRRGPKAPPARPHAHHATVRSHALPTRC